MSGQFIFIDKMESVVNFLGEISESLNSIADTQQAIYEKMDELKVIIKPQKKIVAKKKKI